MPQISRTPTTAPSEPANSSWFAGLVGTFLGLCLVKFGNPAILDRLVARPTDVFEFVLQPWPIAWGYVLLVALALAGLVVAIPGLYRPPWQAWLPAFWLLWQGLAATRSIEPRLTYITLGHFAAAVACYYLGLFALSRCRRLDWMWAPLVALFLWMLWTGFGQHYGGLDETRRMFYAQPDWQQKPIEMIKRFTSTRIFATLLYPNALAGALLLLSPAVVFGAWGLSGRLPLVARASVVGMIAYAALACLVWSGSKAGWLIALVMGLAWLLQQSFDRRLKVILVGLLVVVGLAGFFLRYSRYFSRGATSVTARLEYWRAAVTTAGQHPWLGTGPGTFSVNYRRLKPPEAEMALLTHNDYLEQACDSGLAGAILYLALLPGSLVWLYAKCRAQGIRMAVWLGLLGWAIQSFVEFGLYLPALAWTGFCLLGWLSGLPRVPNEIDNQPAAR